MKIFYFTLLLLLVVSLIGLEMLVSRVSYRPVTPSKARDFAVPASGARR